MAGSRCGIKASRCPTAFLILTSSASPMPRSPRTSASRRLWPSPNSFKMPGRLNPSRWANSGRNTRPRAASQCEEKDGPEGLGRKARRSPGCRSGNRDPTCRRMSLTAGPGRPAIYEVSALPGPALHGSSDTSTLHAKRHSNLLTTSTSQGVRHSAPARRKDAARPVRGRSGRSGPRRSGPGPRPWR